VSSGYKSATFNTAPLNSNPTLPESVDSYEIGLKSELFDKRVRVNSAVFLNNIKDPQVQTIIADQATGTNTVGLDNAQKARTKGFETNAEAVLARGLTLRFGGAYVDAKYVSFINAPFFYPIVGGACPPPASAGGLAGGICPPISGNASGHRMTLDPDLRLDGGLNYAMETGAGEFSLDVNAAYTGSFFWDADNLRSQRAYTLLNSSLTMSPRSVPNTTIRLWGKNLTGVNYYEFELPVPGPGGVLAAPAAPRTFGVEFGFKM
jgi:iron complex outermembrane receptor protein